MDIKRVLSKTTKIVGIGANYYSYIEKNNLPKPFRPILFFKPLSSVIFNNDFIRYPVQSTQVEFEAELGVVVAKRCKNVKEKDVEKVILGFTCVNDVTARDLQKTNSQWDESKAFDTFCPIGPTIVPKIDSLNTRITCKVNGKLKQDDNIKNMIFSTPMIVSYLSSIMTLMPGDIISTGTPFGSSPIKKGDLVEVAISGIGALQNRVA